MHFQPLSLILLCVLSSCAFADSYRCVGMDSHGKKINVLYDEGTSSINVNGTILKVEAPTQGKNGVATEEYELEDGTKAYVSLVVEGKNKIVMRQMDAKTDEEIATVDLACED
jgi:hypothetical protein